MNPTQNAARRALESLIQKYRAMSADDRLQMSEASVVRQFIDILLRDVLLWPIEDTQHYKYEVHTTAGRPDITLFPEIGGPIFVEAKKFGVIKDLEQRRTSTETVFKGGQLALTGMATDRTREEQQAINYAFANNGDWAILTNFEKLRLFNARRDWLVISFETPEAYLQHFDDLWALAYPNLLQGSLETLSSQRLRPEVDLQYLEFINEWRLRLAQDILAHPADNAWVFKPDGQLDLPLLRAVVQRYLDRLVMIRFAEDHRVVQHSGTLLLALEMRSKLPTPLEVNIRYYIREFDRVHNSALFAEGLVDQATISEAVLIHLIDKLYEARYRSMPADIMGNTYEQYLGKTLIPSNGSVRTADNLETRKKQGSYYTPQVIVQYIVDSTLGRYLYGTANGQPDGQPLPDETRKTSHAIQNLRVLDSACGSGGFLIYAYQVLAQFYQNEYTRLHQAAHDQMNELLAQGITDELELRIQTASLVAERDRLRDYPRLILEQHLYGVDLDPQAAEIAVVNLMMRAMENRPAEKLLPLILNQNVKVGNSLIGTTYLPSPRGGEGLGVGTDTLANLYHLRRALLTTHHASAEHDHAIRDLQAATAAAKADLNAALAPHFTDLEAVNPFHWAIEFPEVFVDEHGQPLDNPGFTIILGNPPWEILKPDLREFYAQFDDNIESRYTREKAEKRIAELDALDPNIPAAYAAQKQRIEATAAYFRQSPDYTRQGRGDTATHKLFLERSYALLNDGGRLGYVVPSGIYTDLGTKDLREMLLNEGRIEYIFSFSNERFFFPGVDHRFKFALLGAQKGQLPSLRSGEGLGVGTDGFWAAFRFNPRVAISPDDLPSFLSDEQNLIYVRTESIARFNPDSLSVMEFQTSRDYDVAEKIYNNWSMLGQDIEQAWNIRFTREFDSALDRSILNSQGDGLPLYLGRMIHQFDAFFAQPELWINESTALGYKNFEVIDGLREYQRYRLGFRGITGSTNARTLIAAILPPNCFAEAMLPVADNTRGRITYNEQLYLAGLLNSLVLDWTIRMKVATRINNFHLYQLPMPRLQSGHPTFDAIVRRAAQLTCTRPEFAALWESVMGETWDTSKGVTDSAARQQLRDEIDALVAHLYGLSAAEFEHILGTFPLVFPSTPEGETKKAKLLATFSGMGDTKFG